MNIKQGIRAVLVAVAASAALVLTGGAASAGTAPASPPPGIPLVSAQVTGWSNFQYRPGVIYVGQRGLPFVTHLSWRYGNGYWNYASATTRTGEIVLYWPQPGVPSYLWPYSTHFVSVYLHAPLTHNGQPYFSKMRWTWHNVHGVPKAMYWLTVGGDWSPR